MKKITTLIVIIIFSSQLGKAQDIYNTILEDAQKVAFDENSNNIVAKIAMFKYNELKYIKETAFKCVDTLTTKFLDDQAYYMNEYIGIFFNNVLLNQQIDKKEKKDLILLFIDASCSNPLFNDSDKEVTYAYVNDSNNQLTPFCLDTDWLKAYVAVTNDNRIKNIIK